MLYDVLYNIESVIEVISDFVGYIAVVVVLIGILHGLFLMIKHAFDRKKFPLGAARMVIGEYLLLGLEFLIAKDILETVLEPTLSELTQLGVLVVIRIILNFFIEFDLEGKHKFMKKLFRK